jgi:type IV pilus assembly protein PilA
MSDRRTLRYGRSMGFTLIELMITVAIIGVLALLATVGYSRWLRTAKTAEATAMLGNIKSAEETWRAEHLNYKGITTTTTAISAEYPAGEPNDSKVAWNTSSCTAADMCGIFRQLNVQADGAVYYRYGIVAGPADGAARVVDGKTFSGAAYDPWFVARARGDLNGDKVFSKYWTSSFDTTIVSENPGD